MTRSATLALLCLLAVPLHGQVRATTTDGRTVLLSPDGTWKYAGAATAGAAPAGIAIGTKPAGATAKIDFWRDQASVWYDPTKWHIASTTEGGRTSFVHTSGDGYALVIAERLQMSLDALRNVALSNAQAAAADARISEERTVRVNGVDMLELRIDGTLQGIAFTYFGHYYTSAAGTVQILTYTGANLFDEYRPDFQEFLNGFTAR